MARLNEAPLRNEGIDPEKRKFVRNNNDLIRANYTQQKKIRDLELETSRLRSENLCLREEVLRLQNRLSDLADNVQLSEIESLHQLLQGKLDELGQAVTGLGQYRKPPRERREPNPASWKREFPILEVAGRARRMPSIPENRIKSPRRSLDIASLQLTRLSDQSSDSPDLGPPPVAHFDYVDPIKFDQPAIHERRTLQDGGFDLIPAELAVNLETRRKRRESQLVRPQTEEASLVKDGEKKDKVSGRAGNKRKLDVREGEEAVTTAELFNFTKRSIPVQEAKLDMPTSDATSSCDEKAARKILGDKSVNLSPRKIAVGKKPSVDKAPRGVLEPNKLDEARQRTRRARVSTVIPMPMEEVAPAAVTIVAEPESLVPKTPAADILSPMSEPPSITSSEPTSTSRDPGTLANLEGMVRPSRRARSVASYAEPSLNSKMRRPTKDLVDAVYGNVVGSSAATPGITKNESIQCSDSDWKNLAESGALYQRSPSVSRAESGIPKPTSPILSSRGLPTGDDHLPGRPRRMLSAVASDDEGTRRDALTRRLQRLDLHDFKDIALPDGASLEVRKTRRHSSVSTASGSSDGAATSSSPQSIEEVRSSPHIGLPHLQEGERQTMLRSTSQHVVRPERLTSRRRSMLV